VAGGALAELGERQPACFEMLVAQDDVAFAHQPAGEGQDAHEAARQHLEPVLVERVADLDRKPRLLAYFAHQRRAMILARIGPSARQIPFAALVQQQEHTVVVYDDTLDGNRVSSHCREHTCRPERSEGPHRRLQSA